MKATTLLLLAALAAACASGGGETPAPSLWGGASNHGDDYEVAW